MHNDHCLAWRHRTGCRCEWCSAQAFVKTAEEAVAAMDAVQRDTMSDMENDRQISMRLPSDMLEALDRVAEDQDRTIGWVIRQAIRQYLDKLDDRS